MEDLRIPDFPLLLEPSTVPEADVGAQPSMFSLTRWFGRTVNLDDAKSGREILQGGGRATYLKRRGYTCEKLCSEGVTIGDFLYHGYSIKDLIYLGYSWDRLVEIGLRAKHMLRDNGMFVPRALAGQLGVDMRQLHRAEMSIGNLLTLQCSVQELYTLKCTAETLLDMGMDAQTFQQFGLELSQWRQYLQLNKGQVMDQLRLSREDFHCMNWSIVELEKTLAFTRQELRVRYNMAMVMPTTFQYVRKGGVKGN